jgi:ankyrin repeat protein
MSSKHFLNHVRTGIVNEVKKYLEDNPTFNVNEDLYGSGWTALHIACRFGHHEIVSVLLVHPQININQKNNGGSTPLHRGCLWGKVEVVKVLLRDSRVDINVVDGDGCTPLWWASYHGRVEIIKCVIALRGDELDLEKKREWIGGEHTAIEIAREENKTEVASLLERFVKDQAQTRHEIRVELGLVDKDAAELFAMMVFLCDDFMKIKEATASGLGAARFFNIASQFPMELQMVLCYRVFGSAKENIKSKDSEVAFRQLAKGFISSSSIQ